MDDTVATPRTRRPGLLARVTRRALTLRLVRSLLRYAGRRGPQLADAVTYRALFSVFAAVLLGFSALGVWLSTDGPAWDALVGAIDGAVPGLLGEDGIVDPDSIRAPAGFSIVGAISVVALLGSALGAIGSLRTALRAIAGTDAVEPALPWVLLRNLAVGAGIAVAFLLAAATTFAGELLVRGVADLLGTDASWVGWGTRAVSLVVVFALDTALIALTVRVLSGLRPGARALWAGAVRGGPGLLVLQELSGLFVGGARSNPLLVSFASLLALLIWINLSTQVILVSTAWIATAEEESRDRVRARYGAQTLAQHAVRSAEEDVRIAQRALRAARDAEAAERGGDGSAGD